MGVCCLHALFVQNLHVNAAFPCNPVPTAAQLKLKKKKSMRQKLREILAFIDCAQLLLTVAFVCSNVTAKLLITTH